MQLLKFVGAIAAALVLSGCFNSKANLVPAGEVLKPFPQMGFFTVTNADGKPPMRGSFSAANNGYRYMYEGNDGDTEVQFVRFAKFKDGLVIAQRQIGAGGDYNYGLGRITGTTFVIYRSYCSALPAGKAVALGLVVRNEGGEIFCDAASWGQIKGALQALADKGNLTVEQTYQLN